jgi:hypothetical protein
MERRDQKVKFCSPKEGKINVKINLKRVSRGQVLMLSNKRTRLFQVHYLISIAQQELINLKMLTKVASVN